MSIALAIWAAIKGALSTIVDKLSLCQIVCITLGCLLLLQTVRIEGLKLWPISYHGLKEQVTNARAATAKCQSDRLADRQAYAKAQADAQAQNLATVARDKAERERITNDISQSYESDLARLRAELAARLPKQGIAPDQGASGDSGLPDVSAAPSGPDGSSRLSIPPSLYVRGAELELQLERLQQWVNEQLKVNPNK